MKIETVSVLGVKVARMSLQQVVEWIRVMVEQGKPRHIVTANAEVIYKAHVEPEYLELLQKSDLVTADGSGVVLAANMLGQPVPERVAGIDLVAEVFELAAEKNWSIYFLGAEPDVVEKAVLHTLEKYPSLQIKGYRDGYYSQEETEQVVSNINKLKPDILLVALGVPKQEVFIQQYLKELDVPLSIGVGGSFDILAGTATRAPVWMQRVGLEWSYRLFKEPRRFKRMLALPKFVLAVLKQKLTRK